MKTTLLSAGLLALLGTAALAEPFDFSTFDTDGDGLATRAEVEAAPAERFAKADADGNGGLSADEIAALHAAQAIARAERFIERLDSNRDGLLQAEEMADNRDGRRPPVERIFERLDTDGDVAISEAEFEAGKTALQERRERRETGEGRFNHRGGHGHGGEGGPDRLRD